MTKKNKALSGLTFFLVTVSLIINYYGPRMIIQINGGVFSYIRPSHHQQTTPEYLGLVSENLKIISHDGLQLSAILIKANTTEQKGTVILVHGIRAYKEHFLPVCKRLADEGFNSVIIDLRGHGESEGLYCTFGYHEKKDIKALVDVLYQTAGVSNNLGVWGQSLGGAVALQALALDKRLKFGIIESTFADFRNIVYDYTRYHLGFNIPKVTDYFIWRAESIGHFNADSIRPAQSAKEITQPVLLVHGEKDGRIKYKYGKQIFENLAYPEKEFISYPEGNHLNVWAIGGERYFEKVIEFLERSENEM